MMNQMDIAFPNLGIYLENVPQAFYIGDFRIALYGCMIALGMMLGILMAAQVAKKTGQSPDTYWDISVWLIIFSLIGARIYYVIFFWDAYKDNLLQIFNFRAGGLAIYGGVIGGILTAYVYCLIKKKFLPEILDTAVYGLLVGQIIGRWGNFFNREVFGGYTDGLLAMRLPISMVRDRDITPELAAHIADGTNYIQVHPTFLYEGLWNLALLIFLLLFLKHRRFKGEIFFLYLAGYGIGRAWIEAIRTDQLYIGSTSVPVNMVMGIALAAAAILAIALISIRKKKTENEQDTEKNTFCVSVRKAKMELAGIHEDPLILMERKNISVDVVLHLSGKNQDQFNIVVPVADTGIIWVTGKQIVMDASLTVSIIVDHIF